MKKNPTLRTWLIALFTMAITMSAFTSCDDDVDMSITLSGDWYGDFGMYYDYFDRHGDYIATFDSYDTDISFIPDYDYATHGYGYQVDYYRHGPYSKVYHSFEWYVNNEVLSLHYKGERELDTKIYDFRLTDYYFTGYFDDSPTQFRLKKTRDFYWDPYCDRYGSYTSGIGYGYYYNDDWYYDDFYARTRTAEADTTATEPAFTIRFGNRFKQ